MCLTSKYVSIVTSVTVLLLTVSLYYTSTSMYIFTSDITEADAIGCLRNLTNVQKLQTLYLGFDYWVITSQPVTGVLFSFVTIIFFTEKKTSVTAPILIVSYSLLMIYYLARILYYILMNIRCDFYWVCFTDCGLWNRILPTVEFIFSMAYDVFMFIITLSFILSIPMISRRNNDIKYEKVKTNE